MKVKVRPAKSDSGVSCLVVSPENEEEKQQLNAIFVYASLCQCEKSENDLVFILKPQRTLVRDNDGKLVDMCEAINEVFGGV